MDKLYHFQACLNTFVHTYHIPIHINFNLITKLFLFCVLRSYIQKKKCIEKQRGIQVIRYRIEEEFCFFFFFFVFESTNSFILYFVNGKSFECFGKHILRLLFVSILFTFKDQLCGFKKYPYIKCHVIYCISMLYLCYVYIMKMYNFIQ